MIRVLWALVGACLLLAAGAGFTPPPSNASSATSGTEIKYVVHGELASIFEASAASPLPYETSPFGVHPASVGAVPNLSFSQAQDIGVRWHRPPVCTKGRTPVRA